VGYPLTRSYQMSLDAFARATGLVLDLLDRIDELQARPAPHIRQGVSCG
jgi:hypothetical protein